jgi:hypothetical protein
MTEQEKLNLVTNYFAEDWAIEKAMGLLEDYEKVVDALTKRQRTTEVLDRMQRQEDGHNKNPFRQLLNRLMRNEGGYSTTEIGQLKYALDGFYGSDRDPAESVPAPHSEPWYGHQFKEVRRGYWQCSCEKAIAEAVPSSSKDSYPPLPNRYAYDDDGGEMFTADHMRAYVDADRAARKQGANND